MLYTFQQIKPAIQHDTPLWFYILAEAQASVVDALKPHLKPDGSFSEDDLIKPDVAKTQLGWVGGRIVAEVFYGLMDSDRESYIHAPEGWEPIWAHYGFGKEAIFANLLKFAGQKI